MKVSKILLIALMLGAISIFWAEIPTIGFAEEVDVVAQLTTKPGATVTPVKPKLDCKWTEEKSKDGKITYKLTGKECEKLEQDVNSQQKAQGKTCCVCKREGGIIVCRGECCIELFTKASSQ